jgi:hypothetical protein
MPNTTPSGLVRHNNRINGHSSLKDDRTLFKQARNIALKKSVLKPLKAEYMNGVAIKASRKITF